LTDHALCLAIICEDLLVFARFVIKGSRTKELIEVAQCVAKDTILEVTEAFIHLTCFESPLEEAGHHSDTARKVAIGTVITNLVFVKE